MRQTRGGGSYIQIYLPTFGALIILLHMNDLGISFSGDIKVIQLLIVFHKNQQGIQESFFSALGHIYGVRLWLKTTIKHIPLNPQ